MRGNTLIEEIAIAKRVLCRVCESHACNSCQVMNICKSFGIDKIKTETISKEDMYVPVEVDFTKPANDWNKALDINYARLDEIDEKCKERGLLLGRIISVPIADGYGHYQVTVVSAEGVEVKHITGLCDDYKNPEWGDGCLLPIERVKNMLSL